MNHQRDWADKIFLHDQREKEIVENPARKEKEKRELLLAAKS